LYFGVHASASGGPNRAIETRTARRVTGFRSRSELARTKSKPRAGAAVCGIEAGSKPTFG
jgi:hypothetical protein